MHTFRVRVAEWISRRYEQLAQTSGVDIVHQGTVISVSLS